MLSLFFSTQQSHFISDSRIFRLSALKPLYQSYYHHDRLKPHQECCHRWRTHTPRTSPLRSHALTPSSQASGNVGSYIAAALLKTGKHNITGLTRAGGSSKLPDGITVKTIDYDDPSTIVAALQGQDALVITLSGYVPHDTQSKLIRAAAEASVPWILPNEYSPDTASEALIKDIPVFQGAPKARAEVEELGKSSFVSVACGFWYEWSIAIAPAYGFDFDKKEATFFDDGKAQISTSTWPQVGRAVAALLSLPIEPENGDAEKSLAHFRNQMMYVNSFTVSQQEMLDSVLRVTGDKLEDWTISKENAEERYNAGMIAMKQDDRMAFVRALYTRPFFASGEGNFDKKGLANGILGLPKEDLDEATKIGIKRANETEKWT